jgi:hypothetical protein
MYSAKFEVAPSQVSTKMGRIPAARDVAPRRERANNQVPTQGIVESCATCGRGKEGEGDQSVLAG